MATKKRIDDVENMDIDELFARKKQIDEQLKALKSLQNETIAEAVLRDLKSEYKSRSMDASQITREMVADWVRSFADFLSSDGAKETGNMRTKIRQIERLKQENKQLKQQEKTQNQTPKPAHQAATVHSDLPTYPVSRG